MTNVNIHTIYNMALDGYNSKIQHSLLQLLLQLVCSYVFFTVDFCCMNNDMYIYGIKA